MGFEDIEYVDVGTYDAATNMAIEELVLERTRSEKESYLRVMGFEEPSFVLARRTPYKDIEKAVESGFDYTRCETAGSTIPCLENGLAYSVSVPTSYSDKDQFFKDVVGQELREVLSGLGFEEDLLEVEKKYSAIRYGKREQLNKTVVGNSLWRKNGSILCHGVICLDSWDTQLLEQNMSLREDEAEFIESLPSVKTETGKADRYEVTDILIDRFAGDNFEYLNPVEEYSERVEELVETKYGNESWIKRSDQCLDENKGHCFVERDEKGFY